MICNNVYANQIGFDFNLDNTFQYKNIAPFVEVYGDTSLIQDFEYVLKNEKKLPFRINERRALHKGVTNAIWWVKFPIKNNTPETREFLLEIAQQGINGLQLFVVKKDTIDSSIKTGIEFPFQQRVIQYRHYLFPFFLEANESATCYLMANDYAESFVLPIELWEKKAFLENNSTLSLNYGIYLGVLCLYIFIPILLIILTRTKISIYYFFLVISLTLYILATEGFGRQFLWTYANSSFNKVIRPSLIGAQLLFLILFCVQFFIEKGKKSRLLKILIWERNIIIFLLPTVGFLTYLFMGTSYSSIVNFVVLSAEFILYFTSILIILWIALFEYYRIQELDWLVIALIAFTHIGVFVLIMANFFGLLNSGPHFHKIMLINVTIEMIIVSILLFSEYWRLSIKKKRLQTENSHNNLRIANTLLQSQSKERLRIAENLKNQLQPLLTQSQFIFKKEVVPTSSDFVQKIDELLQKSQVEVNRIANNLVPQSIYQTELTDNINTLCQSIDQSKTIKINFSSQVISSKFPIDQRVNIYRIVQELLNNVIKHALATKANVLMIEELNCLKIIVEDDGIGLDESTYGNALLLENKFSALRFRIKSMDGEIMFSKSELSGLKVEIQLPINST